MEEPETSEKKPLHVIQSRCFKAYTFVVSSELLQMGGSVDFQMISTPSSIVPRALNTKVKMQVLGKSLNLFEVGKM